MKNNENTLLASLAVFRKLYNTADGDIYSVIAAFITDIIKTQKLNNFSLYEIKDKLNTIFEFNIPIKIIKVAIKRLEFISLSNGKYIISNYEKINSNDFNEKQSKIIINNQKIIDDLYHFIETKQNKALTKDERQVILENFCNFLIDKNNGIQYLEYITAFLIKNENDSRFNEQLNLIREGVILYTGIKFNNNISKIGSWQNALTIFLETDILFDIAGYNGELYTNIIMDLLNLISEINNTAKKQIIKLCYFQKTYLEIEAFFNKAESIIRGQSILDPTIIAMVSITDGCKSASDIVSKKSKFYSLLEDFYIKKDTFNKYYDEKNRKYNILSKEIIETINTELNTDTTDCLECLNYISIHRKLNGYTNPTNFENVGYVLLTENSNIVKIAWHKLLKGKEDIPLAIHIGFLTNKLWFKLNKGFGNNSLPQSLSIIAKAQIVLSKILKDNVSNDFNILQDKFKKGELTEKQVGNTILNLRKQIRKPEEISTKTLNEVLSVITEDQLNKLAEEQDLLKIKLKNITEENLRLKIENEKQQKQNQEYKETSQKQIDLLTKNIEEIKKQKEDEKQKKLIRINKKTQIIKIILIIFPIIFTIAISYIILNKTSNRFNNLINMLFSFTIPLILFILNIQSNFYSKFINKIQQKYKNKQYIKNNI